MQRNTPRGQQAASDANVDGNGVPQAFSEAFGIRISKETTPEIHKLLLNMREDAGDLATRGAKEHYVFRTSIRATERNKFLIQDHNGRTSQQPSLLQLPSGRPDVPS